MLHFEIEENPGLCRIEERIWMASIRPDLEEKVNFDCVMLW